MGNTRSLERNPGLIDQELKNQVEFLIANQKDLSIQLDRLIKAHEIDKTTKMQDNRKLIEQITSIRKDIEKHKEKNNG